MSALISPQHLFSAVETTSNVGIVSPQSFGKVAVLLGGSSAERAVSLDSGKNVLDALHKKGVDAYPLDPAELNFASNLVSGKFDCAFVVLHGRDGEDGVIQGMLQSLNIPFTGSGVAASALAMDKVRSKCLFEGLGLPTPRFGLATNFEQAQCVAKGLKFPLAVKPVLEGSSIGISCIHEVSELRLAFDTAIGYGQVMIEEWVIGNELTVSILGDKALPPIEVKSSGGFYDYEAKYESDLTQYLCPAPLPKEKTDELQNIALQSFHAVGCRGWGRADFMQDSRGKFWLLELNTVPGMTSHSLVPKSAYAMGMTFEDLVLSILSLGKTS